MQTRMRRVIERIQLRAMNFGNPQTRYAVSGAQPGTPRGGGFVVGHAQLAADDVPRENVADSGDPGLSPLLALPGGVKSCIRVP
jgi:hypothetical protein